MSTSQREYRVWLVWWPDGGERLQDGWTIRSPSAEHAAETWAERRDADSASYAIAGGEEREVHVLEIPAGESVQQVMARAARQQAAPPAARFLVTGESLPVYCATEVRG